MSRAHPTPQTADGLLIDGVMSYESGDVHAALNRWREALVIDPAHPVASRYTQFVESTLSINAMSTLAEVRAAQERFRVFLSGDEPIAQTLMPAAPQRQEAHVSGKTQRITPSADFEVVASSPYQGNPEEEVYDGELESLDESEILEESVIPESVAPPSEVLSASHQTAPFDPSEFSPQASTPQAPQAPQAPSPSAPVTRPLQELLKREAESEAPTLWATGEEAREELKSVLGEDLTPLSELPETAERPLPLSAAAPQGELEDHQTMPPPRANAPEVDEEVPTRPPQPVPSASTSEPSSEIAQRAMEGPSGPRTQADGLSIQALSRQLAQLHRSGLYDQAVKTAEELLKTDPKHAVARRYIDEYHRQREAAKAKRRAVRDSLPPSAAPAAPEEAATIAPAHEAQPASAQSTPTPAPRTESFHSPSTPTPAPQAPELTSAELGRAPRVLLPFEQIQWQEFDHRAGFFVSQVDGSTSYEDLISISGMPRAEALSLLKRLVERRVIGH